MKILRRLFFGRQKVNAATAKIDEMTYLLDYREHYADVFSDGLESHLKPQVLAELFVFRAWTAQFGCRIFSSDRRASEHLIGETVNSTPLLHKSAARNVGNTLVLRLSSVVSAA